MEDREKKTEAMETIKQNIVTAMQSGEMPRLILKIDKLFAIEKIVKDIGNFIFIGCNFFFVVSLISYYSDPIEQASILTLFFLFLVLTLVIPLSTLMLAQHIILNKIKKMNDRLEEIVAPIK